MKLAAKFIFMLLIGAIYQNGYCQKEPDWTLVTQLDEFKIQERALLVLDQDLYLVGESIHLFASTYDLAFQIPIDFSSILYVELFDQDNHVVSANKYLLRHDEVVGQMVIPKELATGYYYVRAYTNFMKNFGPGAFSTQRIKIVNPFVRHKSHVHETLVPVNTKLNVFAEGGTIVNNIDNKIVFRYSNVNDLVQATLFENDSVLKEITTTNGVGVFSFTPKENKKYRIVADNDKKGRATVELSDIAQSGVVCKLDSVRLSLAYVTIKSSAFNNLPLSLFVRNNGILYEYANKLSVADTSLAIKLTAGLNDIIVKDNDNLTVSERPVYVEPKGRFGIEAHFDKPLVLPGDSLSLTITASPRDSIRYLVAFNLAQSSTSGSFRSNLYSSLFAAAIASRINPLDVCGKSFDLSDAGRINDYVLTLPVEYDENPKKIGMRYLPEIDNDIVSGCVTRKESNLFAISKNMYLSFVDSICWVNRCKTDSIGRFVSKLPISYQGDDLVISVLDTTESFTVKIDEEFFSDFLEVEKEYYYPEPSLKDVIEKRMINLQVNDAYASKLTKQQAGRPDLRFYGYPTAVYDFRKYLNLPNLEEFIYEVVHEAIRVGKGAKVEMKIRSPYCTGDQDPMIILDGVPLLSTDKLASIPCSKLASLQIVDKGFFYGSKIYDGIFDIVSVDKSLNLIGLAPNSTRVPFHPIIISNETQQIHDPQLPKYVTDVYFDKVESSSGVAQLMVKMPQNRGQFSLQVLGYKDNGDWGIISFPDLITIH